MRARILISFVVLCVAATFAVAQKRGTKEARPSPNAAVEQTIGTTDASVTYGRPAVKGREVWGKLVPFGEVWRTGANEATTITVSKDVLVEGQKLPAGTYALFTIPTQTEWTWIFSKNAGQWGAFSYKKEEDVLRVTSKPHPAEHAHEWLTFVFEDLKPDSAKLVLHWEKLEVPLRIQEAQAAAAK
ncbi:MAG: DUF2911 domain-containing protein [Candidatus Acidiferrales bacterium]